MTKRRTGKVGRPALSPEKGKRAAIGLRTTPELKERLELIAASNGRSLSQEIEFRLEQSCRTEDLLGGPQLAQLFFSMSSAAQAIEAKTDSKLTEDVYTAISVWGACRSIFERVAAAPPTIQQFRELPKVSERWRKQASTRMQTAVERLQAKGVDDPTMTEACQEALDTARAEACPHELTKYMEQPLMLWARDFDVWISDANAWKKGIEVAKTYGMEIG